MEDNGESLYLLSSQQHNYRSTISSATESSLHSNERIKDDILQDDGLPLSLPPSPDFRASLWRTTASTSGEHETEKFITTLKNAMLRRRGHHDDVVTIAIKNTMLIFVITILLWIVSYILVMIQILHKDHFFAYNWPLFSPMWLGSFFGLSKCLFISYQLCKTPFQLITSDRRLHLRFRGLEMEQEQYLMDLESLPLMRIWFFYCIVIIISFIFILITQILFYLWFIGIIHELWHVIVPLKILFIGYLMYMYLVKVFSLRSCFLLTLGFIQFVLFIGREEYTTLQMIPWIYLASPFMMILIFSYYKLIYSFHSYHNKSHFLMTSLQVVAMYGYLFSITIMALGLGSMITYEEYNSLPILLTTCYVAWTVAIPIFTISALIVVLGEGSRLVETRGYPQPKVLARTPKGWSTTTIGGHWKGVWLLGHVKTKLPNPMDLTQKSTIWKRQQQHEQQQRDETVVNLPLHSRRCCSSAPDECTLPEVIALQAEYLGITPPHEPIIEGQIEMSPLGSYRDV